MSDTQNTIPWHCENPQLRADGFPEAAATFQPDPALVDAAWGEEEVAR
ncbi:hypothetical protein KUF83_30435 [Streptomyces sp. BV286]|nr:hypothetical protein [Streptomyces sp. BV286]MBV1940855.1 hypothetical protein [Streptomyces sp. BV286]